MNAQRDELLAVSDELRKLACKDETCDASQCVAVHSLIARIRAIAASMSGEVVAWGCEGHAGIHFASEDRDLCVEESTRDGSRIVPLYNHPQPRVKACVWTRANKDYEMSCGRSRIAMGTTGFTHCPYCGGKIKESADAKS